jgi:hypothetical protein
MIVNLSSTKRKNLTPSLVNSKFGFKEINHKLMELMENHDRTIPRLIYIVSRLMTICMAMKEE